MEEAGGTFLEWLQTMRRASGYRTDAELCRDLHIPQSTLTRWKKGDSKPSIEVLVKVSKLFGVSLEPLLVMADHVPADAVTRSDLPTPPDPTTPGQRIIETAPLDDRAKREFRTYWERRMDEERRRLERLIEMVAESAHNDNLAKYAAQGEVTPSVQRRVTEVTSTELIDHVVLVLVNTLFRSLRGGFLPRRKRRSKTSSDEDSVRDVEGCHA